MSQPARLPDGAKDSGAAPSTAFTRRLTATLSIIVAIVVVISVIVAWYAAHGNQRHDCDCGGAGCPLVTFSLPNTGYHSPSNYTEQWQVSRVVCLSVTSFSAFEALIEMNGTSIGLTTLAANTILSFGPEVKAIVGDLDGNGVMSVGDEFLIYGMGEPHSWRFHLIWAADESLLNSVYWDTP